MKSLPGLKPVGFLTLASIVAFTVYATAEEKESSSAKHPKLIVKLGWEGATPEQSEPVNYSPKQIKAVLKRFLKDPTRYRIRHYKDDGTVEDEGELQTCVEPEPAESHSKAEPSPTPRPSPHVT